MADQLRRAVGDRDVLARFPAGRVGAGPQGFPRAGPPLRRTQRLRAAMLGWRLLVSAFLIPGLVVLFYLDQRAGPRAPVLFAFGMALAVRSAWELVELFGERPYRP